MDNEKAVEASLIFQAILERSKQWVEEGRMKPRWVGVRPGAGAMPRWARSGGPDQPGIAKA